MSATSGASQYAITSTFTPPATCTQSQFTMMAAHSYYVYLNYPDPVPSSTITDCWPSQFISSYFAQQTALTALPAIEPLICPKGYQSVSVPNQPDGYLACCPSNMGLATSAQAPFTRPAFNGTCYSDVSTILVTAYGTQSITTTSTWSAPAGAQAYGIPIEGYAFATSSNSSAAATSSQTASASSATSTNASSSATSSETPTSHSSHKLSGGAIAGAVVGSVAGAALILGALFLLVLRPRRKRTANERAELDATQRRPELGEQEKHPSEMGGEERWAHRAQNPVELSTEGAPVEMDAQGLNREKN